MKKETPKPEQLINRELSWLEFNRRVLDEAANFANPLFERMKFLSIAAANLDEFFMIRTGALWNQIDAGYQKSDVSGLSPRQQISEISCRTHAMVGLIYDLWRHDIEPALRKSGIRFLGTDELTPRQLQWAQTYYDRHIYPVLTPMAVDAARPFPLILSRTLNLGLLLEDADGTLAFATVQIPASLSRLIRLEDEKGATFLLLEQLISLHLDSLLCGRRIIARAAYRITRNADLSIDEDDADDLPQEIEKSLKQRRWGAAVRLEIEKDADIRIQNLLIRALELEQSEVYEIDGAIDPSFLMRELYSLAEFDSLRYPPHTPRSLHLEEGSTLFDRIREKDLLLHHPYDSFQPVIDFVRGAAHDPQVLAVKQTLYRVSDDSPIISALIEAAEKGKQVTVLLELKARFDEENNIHCGRRLEKAGAHVIYGVTHLKTHAKVTLIVRREDGIIRRYVHLGTGNYNDITAHTYTDHGLFTCRESFGGDASAFFNMLSGHTEPPSLQRLCAAPHDLREKFLFLIERERAFAALGKRAEITAKMNSLVDPQIISSLYRASQAGVKIRLMVRGICCLRPGLKGISENIAVRSIVGRFLEHSRIYLFRNDGHEEIYLSSADWMPRNLDRRVELLFPIEDDDCRKQLKSVLRLQWADNLCSREMQADGTYKPILRAGEKQLSAQEQMMHKGAPH